MDSAAKHWQALAMSLIYQFKQRPPTINAHTSKSNVVPCDRSLYIRENRQQYILCRFVECKIGHHMKTADSKVK